MEENGESESERVNFSTDLEWLGGTPLPARLFVDGEGNSMTVFVYGNSLRKRNLCQLLENCGAKIAGSANTMGILMSTEYDNFSTKLSKKVYSHRWVLRSILRGEMVPMHKFVLHNGNGKRGKRPAHRPSNGFGGGNMSGISDVRVIVERRSSSEAALDEEEDSESSGDFEEDIDDEEVRRKSDASQIGFQKMLQDSSKKQTRSRRLHSMDNTNHNLENGLAGSPTAGDPLERFLHKSSADSSFRVGGVLRFEDEDYGGSPPLNDNEPEAAGKTTVEEMVAKLAGDAGCSRKIALHALLVNGGNVGRARRYLRGGETRPWTAEEDNLIRNIRNKKGVKSALNKLSKTRSQKEIVKRCSWMSERKKPVEKEKSIDQRRDFEFY